MPSKKLIVKLKEQYPNLKIQWIIRKNQDAFLADEMLSCADSTVVVDAWEVPVPYSHLMLNPKLLLHGWFTKAYLVLSYPICIFKDDPYRVKSLQEIFSEILLKGQEATSLLQNSLGFSSKTIQESNDNYFKQVKCIKRDTESFVDVISDLLTLIDYCSTPVINIEP